jgi:hypothetical protein
MGLAPRTRFIVRSHLSMEQIQEPEIGCYVEKTALLMHGQERVALRLADAVMAPTPSYAQSVQRKYGLPASQIVLSPLPVGALPPAAPPAARDTILFVARLFHFKGADLFVDAAVRLLQTRPQLDAAVRFVLVGYDSNMGPGRISFEEYLRRRIPPPLRGRFQFTGQIAPAEVAQWLARSICYVCPSRIESFAYSVHEAAAMGIPLILNDLPAFTDLFHDEVDCLKFDGSSAGLADKIGRIITDDDLRRRVAQPRRPVTAALTEPYEQLAARSVAAPIAPASVPSVLVVMIDSPASSPPASSRAVDLDPAEKAIAAAWPDARLLRLVPAAPDSSATLPLFGRFWTASADALSADLLLVCMSGDRFSPDYLRQARHALAQHADLGFVAPLAVADSPETTGAAVDLDLPVWPLLRKTALTRSLMRTPPGLWLVDLLDRRADAYAEITYLWSLQDAGLSGFQWPVAGADLATSGLSLDDPAIFQSMLLRNVSADRMAVQSRFLAQAIVPTTPPLVSGDPPPLLQRIHLMLLALLPSNRK